MTFLEMSLSGAVFVLAIAAFRALALSRLPKGTFVALWWLAVARLLLPVEFSSRFSVYTLLEALRPQAAVPAAPVAPTAPAAPPVLIVPAQPMAAPPPQPEPFPVWTALWLSVGLLLAAWFLIRYVRWRRRFREALPADCPGLDTWFRRSVRVRVTDQIAAPLTYGLLRPVILLPKAMDLTDEEALTCVLAHERVHIRRLDGLLKLALTAALCLHWFNPAAWLLYVLGNRDMELRCDEAAVLALGGDSRERYAMALIRLAENKHVPLCGFAHRNGMEERIKAIMSVKKKSLLACMIALALVLGITTAFATSAKPAEPGSPADEPWNGDMIDRELHAQSSAESAAQWDEVLAPYATFGLSWTFDDPDLDGNGLSMTWEGREVSGIYDEEQGLWITEHTGNGAYGPGAVELYTVYEDGKLSGLRLATKEEQAQFARDRQLASDALKVELLTESVRYDSGNLYFTIPDSEEPWSIFIQGRVLLEDGSGMSVHYLQEESEKAEWVPQMTYSFEVADAAYDELTMDIKYGNADYCYPLTLLLPEGKPQAVEPLPEGKADVPEDGSMVWPVDGGTISQAQGTRANPGGEGERTHNGVDIAVETGTPVYAAGKGTVKEAGFNATDGNFVRIDHGRGQETFYAHCASLWVDTGDEVMTGQTIATVGSTGQSTGPHLHFEFLVNGVATDPLVFDRNDYLNNTSSQINPFYASVGITDSVEDSAGRPIIAIMDGTVLDAGVKEKRSKPSIFADLSGPYVEILYEDGYSMKFQLCQSVLVKTGDKVKAGDVIGYTGEIVSGEGPTSPQDRANEEKSRQQSEQRLVNGDYPRNSRGETYGLLLDVNYAGYEPDLIGASNGEEEGYVTKEDFFYESGLEGGEWFALDNWRAENNVSGIALPMYDSEHNLIGEWVGSEDGKGGKIVTIAEVREVQKKGFPNANGSQPIDRGPHFETIEEAQEALRNGWPDDQ